MGFFNWHQKQARKLTARNVNLVLSGKVIIIFIVGSLFSIKLVRYGYYLLAISVILLIHYVINGYMGWYNKKKVSYASHTLGILGLFFLLLFFGIQSPQIPFKIYIIIFGFILTIPGYIQLVKRLFV